MRHDPIDPRQSDGIERPALVEGEQVVGILTRDDRLRELAHALDGELRRAS